MQSYLAQPLQSRAQVGSRVFVHGLASETGAALNFRCGEAGESEDKMEGIQGIQGNIGESFTGSH